MHGQAMELAAQTDREVTDVDHLLHFTQALLVALPHLVAHQLAEVRLMRPQGFSDLTDHLAPFGSRPCTPLKERFTRFAQGVLIVLFRCPAYASDLGPIHRGVGDELLATGLDGSSTSGDAGVLFGDAQAIQYISDPGRSGGKGVHVRDRKWAAKVA